MAPPAEASTANQSTTAITQPKRARRLTPPPRLRIALQRAGWRTGSEHLQRSCKTALQLAELVVDVHADGLEGARGRMPSALPRAHRTADDSRALRRRCNRLDGALFDDVAGDATCEAFFSQRTDHVADLVGRGAREPLRGAVTVRRVHTHVERTVGL